MLICEYDRAAHALVVLAAGHTKGHDLEKLEGAMVRLAEDVVAHGAQDGVLALYLEQDWQNVSPEHSPKLMGILGILKDLPVLTLVISHSPFLRGVAKTMAWALAVDLNALAIASDTDDARSLLARVRPGLEGGLALLDRLLLPWTVARAS